MLAITEKPKTNKYQQVEVKFSQRQNLANQSSPDRATLLQDMESIRNLSNQRSNKVELNIEEPKPQERTKDNYIEAFINNKMVTKIFPNTMNWLNISGNIFSLTAHLFGFSDGVRKFAKNLGAICTKAFMVSTSVINIVERCYAKNFLSALGYFNDILIAGTVDQDNTYLARGTASGTYNMANALADSVGKKRFDSIEDHILSTVKSFKKFLNNFFSPNIIGNFLNERNGMWAIFGGIFSNVGALSWMLSNKIKIPTIIRDVAGVMMDIDQLNLRNLRIPFKKNYVISGYNLAVGTILDLCGRIFPKRKDILVPLTFIFDGIGRHFLRLYQNDKELEELRARPEMLAMAAA